MSRSVFYLLVLGFEAVVLLKYGWLGNGRHHSSFVRCPLSLCFSFSSFAELRSPLLVIRLLASRRPSVLEQAPFNSFDISLSSRQVFVFYQWATSSGTNTPDLFLSRQASVGVPISKKENPPFTRHSRCHLGKFLRLVLS